MINNNGEIVKKGRKTNPNSTKIAESMKQLEQDVSGRMGPKQYGGKDNITDVEKRDNNIAALMELYNLPPIDIDDEREVENRVIEYFEWAAMYQVKPSLSSLALALGVSRMTLLNWDKGTTRQGQGHFAIIQKAKVLITSSVEDNGAEGRVNPVFSMFLLNNSGQGFTNNSRVEIAQEQPHTIDTPNIDDMLDDYGVGEGGDVE